MQVEPPPLVQRHLTFDTLDDALRDAEMLLANGYIRTGNWTLAQVCGHLSEWMRFPVDGYPKQPLPIRALMWCLRMTVAKRLMRKSLASKSMPAGNPTLRETIPPPDDDDAAAVEHLRETIARFKAHNRPLHPSPFFGDLDRETATQMQLIHCAHHLSFLVPRPS